MTEDFVQQYQYSEAYLCCDREDMFLKEHAEFVAVATSQAVQVEVDRFTLATSLLAVAARAHYGLPCAVTPPSPPEVLGTTPPDSVKAKFEKQVGCLLRLHVLLLLHISTWSLTCLQDCIAIHHCLHSPCKCPALIAGRISCTCRAMEMLINI